MFFRRKLFCWDPLHEMKWKKIKLKWKLMIIAFDFNSEKEFQLVVNCFVDTAPRDVKWLIVKVGLMNAFDWRRWLSLEGFVKGWSMKSLKVEVQKFSRNFTFKFFLQSNLLIKINFSIIWIQLFFFLIFGCFCGCSVYRLSFDWKLKLQSQSWNF